MEKGMSFTLPWNSTSSSSTLHMQIHNLYGTSHLNAIKSFLSSKYPNIFLMSASKSQYQTEPLLIENVDSTWDELAKQLQYSLFESITGEHMVSTPVCGDTQKYDPLNEILCIRWYMIAVTMPMFRISSGFPWRDPEHLNTTYSKNQALKAINLRNQLLSYYYTLLKQNQPVIRPMFYDFYSERVTLGLEYQYMIGENILVAHPFTSGRKLLHVYLPPSIAVWYEMWGGRMYNSTVHPWINITVLENDFVAFLAQGTLLPLIVSDFIYYYYFIE